MKKTAITLCAAILGAGLLAGCSGGGSEPDERADRSSTTQAAQGSGAGVEVRSSKVIVEQTVAAPDAPDDKTRVGIESLKVEGKTMVLRLVVTPQFTSVSKSQKINLGKAMHTGFEYFGVDLRLIDREHLKEYSVILSDNKWWASASLEVAALNGRPMYAFAVFAAPEDDIDTIDVRLGEQWPDFTDVPISR